jgi:uncharacterized membrane protein SpoIIM required for sporulation
MTAAEFAELRRKDWIELERMLAASARARRLRGNPEELSHFASLFRSACADLAHARAAGYPDDLVDYLNSLTARSHNLFYVAPPFDPRRIVGFFTTLFPMAVRRNAAYVAAGLLLFYGPMLGMISLSVSQKQVLYQVIPRQTLESVEKMYQKGHAEGRAGDQDVAMTGFYVRNNIGIAFQCFAAGIFFGLGSILVLLYNGVVIGAIVGFVAQTPSSMNLLSFVVGHGPFELTAICLSGAAGLRLGLGAVITGNRRRGDSLRRAAREAVWLVIGAAVLLTGAALIEGFWSPSSAPMTVKFVVGAILAVGLTWYLAFFNRQKVRELLRAEAAADTAAGKAPAVQLAEVDG